jgi:hypothetical protein
LVAFVPIWVGSPYRDKRVSGVFVPRFRALQRGSLRGAPSGSH